LGVWLALIRIFLKILPGKGWYAIAKEQLKDNTEHPEFLVKAFALLKCGLWSHFAQRDSKTGTQSWDHFGANLLLKGAMILIFQAHNPDLKALCLLVLCHQ
jgi:hypothetical protein